MLMSTSKVGSQVPQVLVCSAVHLESRINDQNFKPDSIFQRFDLREDERVLSFVSVSSGINNNLIRGPCRGGPDIPNPLNFPLFKKFYPYLYNFYEK